MTQATEQLPLVVETQPHELTPMALIQQATASGADPTVISQLLDLQLKWEANEARKAYHLAMAEFKKNPPTIIKNKKAHVGKYADLAQAATKIAAELSKYGLTHRWDSTESTVDVIRVVCTITHVLGYSESTALSARPDDGGKMNSVQRIASTKTYLERYTLLAATGLAAEGEDDDASGAGAIAVISTEQAADIKAQVEELGVDVAKMLEHFKVDCIDSLKNKDLTKIYSILSARRARAAK